MTYHPDCPVCADARAAYRVAGDTWWALIEAGAPMDEAFVAERQMLNAMHTYTETCKHHDQHTGVLAAQEAA